MEITLSTGIVVTLRPVDISGDAPLTLREALGSALAQAGAKHAGVGAAQLQEQIKRDDPWAERRPEEQSSAELIVQAERHLRVALLRRGCVHPSLDDLLAVYGGTEDQDDLGLGPDFTLLSEAIRGLSGLDAGRGTPDEGEVFLREWGVTLDAMGKRYGRRPSDFAGFAPGARERDRLSLDLGVYYWARGEDSLDEAYRKWEARQKKG